MAEVLYNSILFFSALLLTGCVTGNRDVPVSEGKFKEVCFYGCDSIISAPDTLFVGIMNEGEKAVLEFMINNKSSKSISISRIDSGCGCTTVEWQKSPIEPNEKRGVTLYYNSSGQFGRQFKKITLVSEEGETRNIFLTAEINY